MHKLTPGTHSVKSSSVEQVKKPGHVASKPKKSRNTEAASKDAKKIKRQPLKIKLPRKRQSASLLLTTKGTTAKKMKLCGTESSQKTPLRKSHPEGSGSQNSTVLEHKQIKTQAQATPVNTLTSLDGEESLRWHDAAHGIDKAHHASDIGDDGNMNGDSDDDVVVVYVDPPRNRDSIPQPLNPALLPISHSLSPTDAFFSLMSLARGLPSTTYTPPSPPISPPSSPTNCIQTINKYKQTDSNSSPTPSVISDSSATLTAMSSPCSSPLINSPLTDDAFNLQLSPCSSSAGECESPCLASAVEPRQGTSLSLSPLGYMGLLTKVPPVSNNRSKAKHHSSLKNGAKLVLNSSTNGKNNLNGVAKSDKKLGFHSRRGRMGPMPRPRQPIHHRSVSSSLQTKAAKDSNGSSELRINKTAAPKSSPKKSSHRSKNQHVSVIFKFNGMSKQVLLRKSAFYASSDDSDTDSGTCSRTSARPDSQSKKGVNASQMSLASTAATLPTSAASILKNGLFSHKKVLSASHNGDTASKPLKSSSSNGFNGLSLAHTDPSASGSSFTDTPQAMQSLSMTSDMVRSVPKYCDPVSSLTSIESIQYKQVLLDWQFQLNRQRGGTDDIIFVENEVDRSEPPKDFTYICSNIYGEGVPDPNNPRVRDSLCGCQCYHLGKRCGPKASYCCSRMADVPFAYTLAGKVCVTPGTPIYECNWKCSCPVDCNNRVVQHGRKIPLCIFRTSNNRGWGVKTLQPIKANTFVTEYVGEVITSEEAEKRGKHYDEEGETYLFDLDFDDDQMFTIDAKNYGNISHFFNHSVSVQSYIGHNAYLDTHMAGKTRAAVIILALAGSPIQVLIANQMHLESACVCTNIR